VEFSGVALPGTTMIYGKTPYLAAGMTTIYTDTQDLFEETVEGDNYLIDGQWKPLGRREEVILVKTGKGLEERRHLVRLTHRGPILTHVVSGLGSFDLSKRTISLSWTGYNDETMSLYNILRHIETRDFETARRYLVEGLKSTPSLSMVTATADNHICYFQLGNNPVRRNYRSGCYLKNGSSSRNDWLGLMPEEDRLQVCDPPRGFLVVSNNQAAPDSFHGGYFRHSIFTARADRLEALIEQEIDSGRKITREFGRRLLHDTVDVYCLQTVPRLRTVIAGAGESLRGFDCNFSSTAHEPTLYEVFLL
jgi:penicillin G amidase